MPTFNYVIHLPLLALLSIALGALSVWLLRRSRRESDRRRAAERALAESEARFRALFELNRLPILLSDVASDRIVAANAAAAAFYGHPQEKLVGISVNDLHVLPPEDVIVERRRAANGEKSLFSFRHRAAGGAERDVEVHVTPLREAGRTLLFSIIHDVTIRLRNEAALRVAATFVTNTREAIVVSDAGRRVLDVNPAFTAITGFSREEVIGRDRSERRADLNRPGFEADMLAAVAATGRWSGEARARRRNGEIFWEHLSVSAETDAEGRIISYVSMFSDITERKRTDDQLRLAATVFAHSREGIVVADATGAILDVNAAFTSLTGYRRDEAIGRPVVFLHEGLADPDVDAALWRGLREHGFWSGGLRLRRREGETFPATVAVSAERDEIGRPIHYVGQFSDISHLEAQQRSLERLAHYDALTGLPNRALLAARLIEAMARAGRNGTILAVAYIDLDGFKAINDRHGHETGDRLLVAVAERMQQALGPGDTLARLGGDEFVAVLGGLASPTQVYPVLDRLLDAAAAPVVLAGRTLAVTASIGVAFHDRDTGLDPDQLVRQADHAMYRAKETGRNRLQVFEANG